MTFGHGPSAPSSTPAERVRERVREAAGPSVAGAIPSRYQRIGGVVVVRLPESIRDQFGVIGEAWGRERGVSAVLRQSSPVRGDWRLPGLEKIAGSSTETEVVEFGIRFRLDASRILFARGNREERHRAGLVTRPGETVVDLFAGIGYFAIPAARIGRAARIYACEVNPVSVRYLAENVVLNGVDTIVSIVPGDNRTASIPAGRADRVFLGLLPNSMPWIPRALGLLRPEGGVLHVHLTTSARESHSNAQDSVMRTIRAQGAEVESVAVRTVKAYGPGRQHVVVDAFARPA